MRRHDAGKLVADESENEVLPDAVGDALAEAEDPLSAREVEGVFPYGTTDALVEEEVVRCREEGRGWMEVGPEGPEGLDGRKCRDLLDTLFIVRDLVSWRALLAEPEDPSVFRGSGTIITASHALVLDVSTRGKRDVRTCYGGGERTKWVAPRTMLRDFFLSQRSPFALPRAWSRSVWMVRVQVEVWRRRGRMNQPWSLLESWMMIGKNLCPCLKESGIELRWRRGLRNNWP